MGGLIELNLTFVYTRLINANEINESIIKQIIIINQRFDKDTHTELDVYFVIFTDRLSSVSALANKFGLYLLTCNRKEKRKI